MWKKTPMPTFEIPTKFCKSTRILSVKKLTQLEERFISPQLACAQIYHLLDMVNIDYEIVW